MNVIDYITITCNLKNGRLQITSDYMKKCNRLQLITITPCLLEVQELNIYISYYTLENVSKHSQKNLIVRGQISL